MVSGNIKQIYNLYLKISRTCKNKPYRARMDFDTFYETEQFVYTKKIERLIQNNPSIKLEEFFTAPFILHPNETFPLQFFTTQRAIKMYSVYMKKLYALPLDDKFHLNFIAESLKLIKYICDKNKTNVEDFVTFSSCNSLIPDWVKLIKNRDIDPFIMFGFSNTKTVMDQIDKQTIELIIPDFYTDYYSNLSKFNNSNKAKQLVKRGLLLLKNNK